MFKFNGVKNFDSLLILTLSLNVVVTVNTLLKLFQALRQTQERHPIASA